MTPTNGAVPALFLVQLDGASELAERNTAAAYARLRSAHPGAHINGAAGGYWTRALDEAIHANPSAYGISSAEAKRLSPVGSSPHGLGLRLNIGGITPAIAAQFGFSTLNPYTFTYTGTPSWDQANPGPGLSKLTPDQVRAVAAYLNDRSGAIGRPLSTASSNGIQGPRYWTLVQAAGAVDGLYPQPAYKINGIPGPKTYSLEVNYLAVVNALTAIHADPAPDAGPTPEPAQTGSSDPAPAPATPPAPLPAPGAPPVVSPTPVKAPTVTAPKTPTPTQLAADKTELAAESAELAADSNGTPLAGILAAHTKLRTGLYVGYASAALAVSCAADVVGAGVLDSYPTAIVVATVRLSTQLLLTIGGGLGLVALSNVKK